MKKITKYVFGLLIGTLMLGTTVNATEYSVTPVNAILYSNSESVLYSDADMSSSVVLSAEAFEDNIPIQVTGITSNGFFQVNLGATYYIAGNGLQEVAGVENTETNTQVQSSEDLATYEYMCGQLYNFLKLYDKGLTNPGTLEITGYYKATTVSPDTLILGPRSELYGIRDIAVVEYTIVNSGGWVESYFIMGTITQYKNDLFFALGNANGTYTTFRNISAVNHDPANYYTNKVALSADNVANYALQTTNSKIYMSKIR